MSVRYGVLSTAQIARNQHIPAARDSENSEIVAISSRDEVNARRWSDELDIKRHFGSYQAMLDDPGIDAAINALPNALHCDWTIRAAESGKHILCEKPLAMNTDEALRMIDAAKANGVLLYEGFTQHFNPILPRIHELLDSGAIGKINLVRGELTYTITDWEHDVRVNAELGGGALYDAGCYCVNTIRTILGAEPVHVAAFERIKPRHRVDSTFAGLMRFPGDVTAYITTGMEQPFRWPLEIVGTGGTLSTSNLFSGGELVVRTDEGERTETFGAVNRFALQLDHFSDAVLNGTQLRVGPEDGLKNVAVLQALKHAALSGEIVDVEEF